MAQVGRKPLAVRRVERLEGSARAKRRLEMILKTMRQEITVTAACQELGICESRFHAMRNQWLQEALELLEPRRTGRPPKSDPPEPADVDALQEQVDHLRDELVVSEVRREIAQIIPHVVRDPAVEKKPRSRRRKQRRRPR